MKHSKDGVWHVHDKLYRTERMCSEGRQDDATRKSTWGVSLSMTEWYRNRSNGLINHISGLFLYKYNVWIDTRTL